MIDDIVEQIPVDPTTPYPLGRAGVNHDPRNADYRALVQPPPRSDRPHRVWWTKDTYDQGTASSCAAQAAVGMLRTNPFYHPFKSDWPAYDQPTERHQLYLEAQKHDPWPGGEPSYLGTSTDAPLKVLRNRGHITAWRWLFGEDELREYVTWYGPAVVGTMWWWDMFTPDSDGYLTPTGNSAGGHAYRVVYYSPTRQAYRLVNSWGRGWSDNGRAWLRQVDMAMLLADRGEAVTIGMQ